MNYQDLWLVELDGSSPTLITEFASSPDVVEFGFADAWQVDGTVIVQRWGDCGARWVERLWPDQSVTSVSIDSIGAPWIHATDGDRLVVHSILGCGDFYGPVTLHDSDGFLIRTLVPYIPGYYGVTSVAAMIPTP